MLVFVFLIGLSACFYVYYKVKGIQTKRALEKECFSALYPAHALPAPIKMKTPPMTRVRTE
jgi:hypothetical protein